ncbi:MAG: 5-formyltetrahydrofolate cyclo-ligase [Lachnospiraceae bacterium]|nr:5-formyltetrahydrofolate cyclo-ligase [Lachnospiraceae bacterium]
MESKISLRNHVKEKRTRQPKQEWLDNSHAICSRLMSLPLWTDADAIFLYCDVRGEVSTDELIRNCLEGPKTRHLALPRVEGDRIRFYEIASREQLIPGAMGILEPMGEASADDLYPHSMMVVPGVAFDKDLHRLGYGGGFYDRYLAEHPGHVTVGLGFEFQVVPAVPAETHDRALDMVITEERVIKKQRA